MEEHEVGEEKLRVNPKQDNFEAFTRFVFHFSFAIIEKSHTFASKFSFLISKQSTSTPKP